MNLNKFNFQINKSRRLGSEAREYQKDTCTREKAGGLAFPVFLVLNGGQLKIIGMLKACYTMEKEVGNIVRTHSLEAKLGGWVGATPPT